MDVLLKLAEVRDIQVSLGLKQNELINKKIDQFVNEMLNEKQSASYYTLNRNAGSIHKVAEDIFLGKKAEVFTMYGLHREYDFPSLKIDIEVRHGKEKGWRADLPFSEVDPSFPNVHVKGCNVQTYRYCKDFSWTFQYNNRDGNGGRDDLFKGRDDDLIAFVFMEYPREMKAVIKAVLPWNTIKKHLKDPKKDSLVGLKKCVYYKDLIL